MENKSKNTHYSKYSDEELPDEGSNQLSEHDECGYHIVDRPGHDFVHEVALKVSKFESKRIAIERKRVKY